MQGLYYWPVNQTNPWFDSFVLQAKLSRRPYHQLSSSCKCQLLSLLCPIKGLHFKFTVAFFKQKFCYLVLVIVSFSKYQWQSPRYTCACSISGLLKWVSSWNISALRSGRHCPPSLSPHPPPPLSDAKQDSSLCWKIRRAEFKYDISLLYCEAWRVWAVPWNYSVGPLCTQRGCFQCLRISLSPQIVFKCQQLILYCWVNGIILIFTYSKYSIYVI